MTETKVVLTEKDALLAVLPWHSPDASFSGGSRGRRAKPTPQVEIDFCLERCPYSDLEDCPVRCKGYKGGFA